MRIFCRKLERPLGFEPLVRNHKWYARVDKKAIWPLEKERCPSLSFLSKFFCSHILLLLVPGSHLIIL